MGHTLENWRKVVVTGASRGIGAAIASRLAKPGREMLLVARTASALETQLAACKQRGATGGVLVADLSSAEKARDAGQAILDRIGVPDVLVCNAGVSNDAQFVDSELAAIEYELGVNYIAPLALIRTLLPRMRDHPRSIVAVSSLTAHVPFPGNATYAASKAAMSCFMRSLRIELMRDPLHVGVVLPGYTDTVMSDAVEMPLNAMAPSKVAQAVELCIRERRDCVIPGIANRIAARVCRSLPELSDPVVARLGEFMASRSNRRSVG